MKRIQYIMTVNTVILCLFGLTMNAQDTVKNSGLEAYEKALALMSEAKFYTAVSLLQKALVEWPPIPGDQAQATADYLPYFQLAVCYLELGQIDTARAFYQLEQRRGLIYKVKDIRARVESLEKQLSQIGSLETSSQEPGKDAYKPSSEPIPTPPKYAGSPMKDCEVEPAKDPYDLPWYFHYALAKELLTREQPLPALKSLVLALAKNPTPHPKSRTYGMWFLEYRPYYYMTHAFLNLKRKDCALQAAKQSLHYQEVPPGDPDQKQWIKLLHELDVL